MSLYYNRKLISNAKKLRKNMTKKERHLWYDYLSKYPVRFQRQKVIDNYITDFNCASAKLVKAPSDEGAVTPCVTGGVKK